MTDAFRLTTRRIIDTSKIVDTHDRRIVRTMKDIPEDTLNSVIIGGSSSSAVIYVTNIILSTMMNTRTCIVTATTDGMVLMKRRLRPIELDITMKGVSILEILKRFTTITAD